MTGPTRADYGLDAPALVRGFLIGGPLLAGAGAVVWRGAPGFAGLGIAALLTGIVLFVEGGLMSRSSRVGKLRMRDRLLDGLALKGDERVLDLGCGHGLLLIGAAKRLPRGKAVGIDLWSQRDQGDNRREATLQNAAAEGVAERVELHDGDMRKLPFPDTSFDAIVASISIHNIPGAQGRAEAIREAVRVLKPGGQVALLDLRSTAEYAATLEKAGMQQVKVSPPSLQMFPPVRIVTARKA